HHNSAVCTLAAVLVTRLAACWRSRTPYQLRDLDGRPLTVEEAKAICAERYAVSDADRAKNRPKRASTRLKQGTKQDTKQDTKQGTKQGTSRRGQESPHDAPAAGPSSSKATRHTTA
ncbi:hypothetical protein, partial [Acrocarpospora macrocephala]|uniref:hypothetical protein n=1 Tax=Acrocarpospora macrocephala TaxID=150177 RepID=UPI001C3F961E